MVKNMDINTILGLIATSGVGVIGFFLKRHIDRVDKCEKKIEECAKKEEITAINNRMDKFENKIDDLRNDSMRREDLVRYFVDINKKLDDIIRGNYDRK